MAEDNTGEWKLLKVWECKKCKLLINDGRKVFDHTCTVKEEEDKLLALRKTIDDRDLSIEERDKFIDGQKTKIGSLNKRIEGLEHFITELNIEISSCNDTVLTKDKVIEEYKADVESHKNIIDDHKKTIDNQHMKIEEQNATIESQKKNQDKVVEKVVYLEKGTSNTNNDNVISDINVDIWQKNDRIKDSKDSGYREEIDIEIFERGKGKEKIIIKNGKVIKKPDDIIIIGKKTQEGFIIKGIYRN
jgi:chromosome segregation ATPase